MWLVRSMYNAYTDHDPVDFAGAGAVLAQLGEHYAGRTDSDEAAALEEYGLLSVDMQGSDDVVSIFEGVLTWLQATPTATGQMLLRAWSDCLRSEEHTSELPSLMRISYAVFCLKKQQKQTNTNTTIEHKKTQNYLYISTVTRQ